MTENRRRRKGVAGPLLISALAHVALLVPFSIPRCSNSQSQEQKREKPTEDVPTLTVDILEEVPSSPEKPPRLADEKCDPNAPPEYYHFDIKPGPARDRIYQVARRHFREIIMALDSLEEKESRALRGWFRPFDAVRLLAGDAGLCIIDLHEGIGVNYCHGPSTPFSRSNEKWVRQDWKPPDCTEPKPASLQKSAVA